MTGVIKFYRTGDEAEIKRDVSCELDIISLSEIPGYKPKRKLLKGEKVTFVRRMKNYRGYFVKVKSSDGGIYKLKDTDI